MKTKKRIIHFIESKIDLKLKYNDISSNIEINKLKYLNNKGKTFKYKLIMSLSIGICIICLCLFAFMINPITQYSNDYDYSITITDQQLVENYDYIFIAKVENKVETRKYTDIGYDVPYSIYSISNITYLKGYSINNNNICFIGGKSSPFKYELLKSNNVLIIPGEFYLFFVNSKSENSNDTRISDSDYILKNNYQKILLENYDETLSYVEQREEIKTIIDKYMCYLNS